MARGQGIDKAFSDRSLASREYSPEGSKGFAEITPIAKVVADAKELPRGRAMINPPHFAGKSS